MRGRGVVMWAVAVLATAAVGCGPTYNLTPAGGVLTIDGQPAADIQVQFLPVGNEGPTSFAITDEQGRFTLRTTDGADGAMVGKHKVILIDLLEERPAQGQVAKKKPRLSDRYAVALNGLDAEVVEGGGPIELKASSR